jgi:MFS transporter, FSR family, fosmidomycin resistance protein
MEIAVVAHIFLAISTHQVEHKHRNTVSKLPDCKELARKMNSPKAATARPLEQVNYKSVALLSAAHLCDDVNQGVLPAMLPFFIGTYHLTYAAAAGLVLAQTLSSSVVQPLFGLWADRRSSPWLIPGGMSLAGLGVAASGLAPTYTWIFVSIAISGFGISAFHPEAARRVRYLSGSRQATTMSLFTVGGMVGFALGPLFITPTLMALGTRGALVLALPVLVMAVVLTVNLHRLVAVEPAKPGIKGSVLVDRDEQWGDFVRLTTVVVLRSIAFFGLSTFLPIYWTANLHGTKTGGGMALTALATSVALGTLIGGRLADRYGRKTVIAGSLAAFVPLLLIFVNSRIFVAAIMLLPIGIAVAAANSVVVVMAQDYLPNRIGLAAGVTLGLSMTIGGMLTPVLGTIADHYGLTAAMLLVALVPSLAFAMSLTLHETAGEAVRLEMAASALQSPSTTGGRL